MKTPLILPSSSPWNCYGEVATSCPQILKSGSSKVVAQPSKSKKIMESLRTFVFVETVIRHGRMFQGSDEV